MNINQISAVPAQQKNINSRNNAKNQGVAFTSLKNVTIEGFISPKSKKTANELIELFKDNKYVQHFLESHDANVLLKSTKGGKRLSFRMDVLPPDKGEKPSLLTSIMNVLFQPKKHIKYTAEDYLSDFSEFNMRRYLNETTEDIYRDGPCMKGPSEIFVAEAKCIRNDLKHILA